jgi:putative spermidine/putrescine transport system ATP-binding protein
MPLIEFDEVCKHYPGNTTPAVDHVSFGIEQGEFLTLLGPSGSGKTTSLMMLAGFEGVSSGTIRLDGRPIDRLPAHQRNMGVVFQSYSLFPHLSVAENVAFPLEVRRLGAGEIAARVRRALERVHLHDYAARAPSQLSGGQQQRVALARALVFEPRLVLMDEPLAALDKRLREEMQLEIRRLHREVGVTMVYVTHDQAEAMTLSDRVAVFNRGRIEQLDTPTRLYDAPANPFVASFLGDNNRLGGRLAGARSGAAHVRVELPGSAGTVMARASAGLAASNSQEVTLCVRPERLRVASGDTGDGLAATVIDLIHQGDHWRMIAQLDGPAAGSPAWLVKLAPGAVPAGAAPGQRVRLGFDPNDAWAF